MADLKTSIKVGDAGEGLAWSYYYGYLKLILPGLSSRIEKFGQTDGKISQKLVILLPKSGFCWPTLSDCDSGVQSVGHLEEFEASRAGNPKRSYRNFVYKTTKDNETYYFAAEYATPLLSLYEMATGSLVEMTEAEKEHQMKSFVDVLEKILAHPEAGDCKNQCILVKYDDKFKDGKCDEKISDVILNQVFN